MPDAELLKEYVHKYLEYEFLAVSRNSNAALEVELSIEEQTLIYKYTEDGYEDVNQSLLKSAGQEQRPLGEYLDLVLQKLPNHEGLVFRSANLTSGALKRYEEALQNNSTLVEYPFLSTSTSYNIANMFGGNCRFSIISQYGKNVEAFAKYGIGSGQNEHEILFRANTKFMVLDITKNEENTLIVMEEI